MRSIKDNITVCIIMNDQNIILTRKLYDFFVQPWRGNTSDRIGRQGNNHVSGFLRHFFRDILYIWKEIMFCHQRIIVRFRACHQTSCGKYRITWIWKQYHIAFITKRHPQMSHAFLTSVNGHDHIRCQFHIKSFFIISTDCLKQFRKITKTVLPVIVIHCRFCKCFLDVLRCLKVRCSHTHIINFHTLLLQLHTSVIQGCKDFFSKSV